MAKRNLLDLLFGYEQNEGEGKGKRFASREVSGSVAHRSNSRLLHNINELIGKIFDMIAYTSTRTYGLFLGSFGLLTLIIHFAKDYLGLGADISPAVIIISVLFAVIAVPFMSFDKPTATAMQEFRLTDRLFFEFFCMQRMPKKSVELTLHPLVGVILGSLLAILGAFVPVTWIAIGIGVAVYVFLTLTSPEFSIFLIFLVIPYFPMMQQSELILAGLVSVTLISFTRKTYEGKRIYYFEKYDLLILFMLLIVVVSGAVIGGEGSLLSSLVMLILGFGGYVLTGSLVVNRRLADNVIKANIFASLPISVIAIIEFFESKVGGAEDFSGVRGSFGSSDMLAAYLLTVSVFIIYFILARTHFAAKLIYSVYLITTLFAMAVTLRPWVIVAIMSGLIFYFAFKARNISGILFGVIGFLPYLFLFLPDRWLSFIGELAPMTFLGFDEYIGVWIESRGIFLDNIWLGVGTGDFMDAPYTANFLLQIALEAGVLVLLVFLAIFLTRLQHRTIYAPYIKNSEVSLITDFADISIMVLLVYGLFTPLWSAPTIYYLFWCTFALGSAVLRVSKREFDERVGYFSDGAGHDSSSIDIAIR